MQPTGQNGELTIVPSMTKTGRVHNKQFRGLGHRPGARDAWNRKEFIAWDGEGIQIEEPIELRSRGETTGWHWPGSREIFQGWERQPQPYVLLANSKGDSIANREGLGTEDCFEFLLSAKLQYPQSIFVGFGLNYDVNQMLKDLRPNNLWALHDKNHCYWNEYIIKWFPSKHFYVRHRRSKTGVILYDTFGFFQTSFLSACKSYLGNDDPELGIIKAGKEHRSAFTWEELDEFIIPYNKTELSMMVRIMNILREDLHNADIHPGMWYGPGAVANKVLAKFNVPITRDIPEKVQDASQYAYAGGRFEQFYMGRYAAPVFEYDIRSAYPSAAVDLPDLSSGTWEHVEGFQPGEFGVYYLEYGGPNDSRPHPLFCRSENGTISYPSAVSGWFWTPEASLCPYDVREGYVFHPGTSGRPFSFVEAMYEDRKEYKRQGISTERALKLVLNSLYGKLAQTIGGKDGPPRWHQLEWAGYITSATRAKIYRAIQMNPKAIIAAETDAVFSMVPLDLPLSTKLGDWEMKEYDEITYLQSGFYYAHTKGAAPEDIVCKYRGMDRDRDTGQPIGLPYREVLDHLRYQTGFADRPTPSLHSLTTRYVGLGLGLRTSAVWRSWETKNKFVALDSRGGDSKRLHMTHKCPLCKQGISLYDQLHPMRICGYAGTSYARSLPWRQLDTGDFSVDWSMDSEFRDYAEDMYRWQ